MPMTRNGRPRTAGLLGHDRGAVSIIFATAVLPLIMSVGLAIDYSFYVQAESQLNLAADAGAIHAVRVASTHFVNGDSVATSTSDGVRSGQQWFTAQAGSLPSGNVTQPVATTVTFDASTSTFTSKISYTGSVTTHFAGVFNIAQWPINGSASAVITTNSYVEIAMLVDNSSSMLIGATPTDIIKIENLTLCTPTLTASKAGQNLASNYSWSFGNDSGGNPYGYGYFSNASGNATAQTIPPIAPPSTGVGGCYSTFTGGAGQCPYPSFTPPLDSAGFCPAGYGVPDSKYTASNGTTAGPRTDPVTHTTANIPQAPCGFACHTDTGTDDYWTIVKTAQLTDSSLQLRYDVVQTAAAQVVQAMELKEQVPNQFSLGVFTFNSAVAQVYPTGGAFAEASTNLPSGLAAIQSVQTPIVSDAHNTNFPGAMSYLTTNLSASGSGTSAGSPRKNLFIITDGLEDYNNALGTRVIGQMTSPLSETVCAPLKAKGSTIYLPYTPYYPLPNPFYLTYAKTPVEAPLTDQTNSIAAALQACATTPQNYYQASSSANINTALQTMLNSALNTPGRISQ